MDIQTVGFVNFLLAVLKRRVFLLFLFLGILTGSLAWVLVGSALLMAVTGLGLVFAGFVWAAFLVHRDLSLAYQQALTPKPFEKNRRVGLSITFVPGHEFAYSMSDPYAGQEAHINRMQKTKGMNCHFDERGIFFINDQVYYMMGKGRLEINLQLQNTGDHPLEVASMHVEDNLDLNHLRIYNDGVLVSGIKVRLPIRLESKETITLQAQHKISLAMGSNDALFAADIRALPRLILHEVFVEATDMDGKHLTYVAELKTPSKSLIDLYVKQWQEYGQAEYLMLAGHAPVGEP
ncbi:MAG: hypothetical protein ABI904_10015 [Chloroflexota bacterium]